MCKILSCLVLIVFTCNNLVSGSICCNVAQKYHSKQRYVSINDEKRDVHLYWGSDPARAASAIFKTIIQYGLGYQKVKLINKTHNLQKLATTVHHVETRKFKEVILALSTGWEPVPRPEFGSYGNLSGLAGPRLQELGVSQIPARQQLFLYVAENFRHIEQCANAIDWSFCNVTLLEMCGLINTDFSPSGNSVDKAVVYYLESNDKTIKIKLEERVKKSGQPLQVKKLNRSAIFQLLETSNSSFFFLDYDVWTHYPNLRIVQLAPRLTSNNYPYHEQLDNAISMRVADVNELEVYAIRLLQFTQIFQPSIESLRAILHLESVQNKTIEDAACAWVSKNYSEFDYWVNKHNNIKTTYEIIFFYCKDDPEFDDYDLILRYTAYLIRNELNIPNVLIEVRRYAENCSNTNYAKTTIEHYMSLSVKQRLLGAVIDGKMVTDIAKTVDHPRLPIFMYDAPAVNSSATDFIWLSTGQLLHIALAFQRYIADMGWKRFAILCDSSDTARIFVKEIKTLQNIHNNFTFHTYDLDTEIVELLRTIKKDNARIIFLNTNYENAPKILKAAEKLKMDYANGYVWILREWRPNNETKNMKHLTISFLCRSNIDIDGNQGRKDIRDRLDEWRRNFTDYRWPAKATVLMDAAFTMVHGFRETFKKDTATENDVHSYTAMREFENNIHEGPITGINQDLIYKDRSLEKTMVFLDEWHGDKHTLLQRWLVNSTDKSVFPDNYRFDSSQYFNYKEVADGSSSCLITSGDKYLPDCYDLQIFIGLFMGFLALPTLYFIYRTVQLHEKKRAHRIMINLITQRQQNAAIISDHLVDRSALNIRHELGAGRYGSVRFAELKLPGRTPRIVAAKSLSQDQDERELVREASILAPLVHNHIIRLIGVCIDDKPTLLLMEYAFFGDLLNYLQERWYLAEGVNFESNINLNGGTDEAKHVSAHALTRMAREAASALAYISLYGLVHRDIRASNFLVDANRSLKLGDFGLARKTIPNGADGGAEYASLRRMFLPVRAMAPECLNEGKFSTASDVWALGVLIFELVTLGACPYGDMTLKTIASLVSKGGHPPLPLDATPETVALAQLCWRTKPEERPSAAEIVAYLAEQPCALRPALKCNYTPPEIPDFDDSGKYPLLI